MKRENKPFTVTPIPPPIVFLPLSVLSVEEKTFSWQLPRISILCFQYDEGKFFEPFWNNISSFISPPKRKIYEWVRVCVWGLGMGLRIYRWISENQKNDLNEYLCGGEESGMRGRAEKVLGSLSFQIKETNLWIWISESNWIKELNCSHLESMNVPKVESLWKRSYSSQLLFGES